MRYQNDLSHIYILRVKPLRFLANGTILCTELIFRSKILYYKKLS